MTRYRLAVLASHVIQYQDPFFKLLAAEPDLDVTILYCSMQGAKPYRDEDMKTTLSWDLEMLQGYSWRTLANLGRGNGSARLINPGVIPALWRGRYDAVLFMLGWGTVTSLLAIAACRTAQIPILMFGDSSFVPPEGSVLRRLRAGFFRAMFRRIDAFMISGAFNADYYRHYGADPRRFFDLPWTIDNERFARAAHFAPGEREALRARYGIAPAAVTFLFSAKLIPRKDPMTLLRAFQRMRQPASLVLMGEGELRPEIEAFVREHGLKNVHLTGFVNQSEIPKHYAMADVFVLPSLDDPRGTVINEAMACGLPVIVTDRCGPVGDIVRHGDNGFVFAPGEVDTLTADLDVLAADDGLRVDMSRRSREIIGEWNYARGVAGVRAALHARDPRKRSEEERPLEAPRPAPRKEGDPDRSDRPGEELTADDVTIAIPTYRRGAILVETIDRLLALTPRAAAILIIDQTETYAGAVEDRLKRCHEQGTIRWIHMDAPSIPRAMNEGLRLAQTELVLYLDDDIEPSANLVAAHIEAHYTRPSAVVGQILQPGQEPQRVTQPNDALDFRFNADEPAEIDNVMAGNLSVRREEARSIGGFDENFIGAAYRFETDFARRVVAAGGTIRFEPKASLRHLKLATGGLRALGDHRTTASPAHAVGDYYFALLQLSSFWPYAARRIVKNVATRYHLVHPWTIPTKLAGELRGIVLAHRLKRRGRRLGMFDEDRRLPQDKK